VEKKGTEEEVELQIGSSQVWSELDVEEVLCGIYEENRQGLGESASDGKETPDYGSDWTGATGHYEAGTRHEKTEAL